MQSNHQRRRLMRAAFLAVGLPVLFIDRAEGSVTADSWTGPASGNWFTATNWSAHTSPNNVGGTEYAVTIAQSSAGTITMNGGAATVDSLNISGAGTTLSIINDFSNTQGLTVTNADGGNIVVGSGASIDVNEGGLHLGGSVTTEGGGQIILEPDSFDLNATVSNVVLNNALTIRGSVVSMGGAANGFSLNNQATGVIDADGTLSESDFEVDLDAPSTNAGTMEATGGADLQFFTKGSALGGTGASLTNTGTISAADGSEVDVQYLTLIGGANGQLTSHGTGFIYAFNSILDGTSAPLVNNGSLLLDGEIGNATFSNACILKGTLTNNGTIGFDDEGLLLGSNTTLNGTGTLILGSGNADDAIVMQPSTSITFINASTIVGHGSIGTTFSGAPGLMALVNQSAGVIDSNSNENDLFLYLGSPSSNAGIMRASSGGTLHIFSAGNSHVNLTNTGTIAALDNSAVYFAGINLIGAPGGLLTTTGTGIIYFGGSLDGTTAPIVNDGSIEIDINSVQAKGTLTNDGSISINGSDESGALGLPASLTLSGTGVLTLSSELGNGGVIGAATTGVTLTNASTINGNGYIGGDPVSLGYGTLNILNQPTGLIDANQSTESLILQTPSLTNNGTLRAEAGGTLSLLKSTLTNLSANTLTGGTYQAIGASSVLQLANNADIHEIDNASVTLDGAGMITDQSGNDAFRNLATIATAAMFQVTHGHNFTTAGAILNAGLLTVGPLTTLEITGPLTNTAKADIAGGTLVLDQGLAADTVLNQLHTAWHNGAWDQNGISSSLAQADPTHRTGIGYRLSGSSYTLTDALYGDANLDGTVNSSDFSLLAANYGKHSQVWLNGDFNYDGTVNALDFNALATNYGQSLPAGAELSLGIAVPEPSSFLLTFPIIFGPIPRKRGPHPPRGK